MGCAAALAARGRAAEEHPIGQPDTAAKPRWQASRRAALALLPLHVALVGRAASNRRLQPPPQWLWLLALWQVLLLDVQLLLLLDALLVWLALLEAPLAAALCGCWGLLELMLVKGLDSWLLAPAAEFPQGVGLRILMHQHDLEHSLLCLVLVPQ